MEWTVAVVTTSDVFWFSCYICQRKKQYRHTTNGKKQKMQFSHPKNSVFRLLCVMDLISNISPISPSNKVQHGPFGGCSGIFRHILFTKSRFHYIVYKLPSTFLVLWHTKLQPLLQWFPLRHFPLCGTFVSRLGPVNCHDLLRCF